MQESPTTSPKDTPRAESRYVDCTIAEVKIVGEGASFYNVSDADFKPED